MSIHDYKFSEHSINQGLLHTPEGVRDIYNAECARKLKTQDQIHTMFSLYGFKDIQTPSFEFFDIFNKERGTIASKEMYKFFDREGNTLVLRPDITPSIARCAAKYYKEEELPIRFCYMGNTFINNSSYQGKLKEVTQLGAELINDSSVDADAEMIAMTIESLLKVGLKEFQVEIGHAEFFHGIAEEANFTEEERFELKSLLETKNLFGVENLLETKQLSKQLKEVILKLPDLFGNEENLAYAKSKVKNERALKAIERLEKLTEIIDTYGFKTYVSYDLGMLSKYDYYDGIIFKAYTHGTGEAVATGGRYDQLVGQFGKQAPAIGVAIVVDQLLAAMARQKIEIPVSYNNTLIVYEPCYRKTAIELANHFRKDGIKIELLRKSSKRTQEDYMEYGTRNLNGGIFYIQDDEWIKVINLLTGAINDVNISSLTRG